MRHWNKELRMNRLFDECGKTVMVAMDHGQGGVKPGLAHPERLIKTLIAAKPDAILLSGGMARTYNYLFGRKEGPALVVSSDFIIGSSVPQAPGDIEELRQSISVEECVRLGADAVKALLIFGRRDLRLQADNMEYITRLARDCDRWNLPLIVEPTTWGAALTEEKKKDISLYADMARIAGELGADLVKCDYFGTPEEFRSVVDNCPVPVAILGGAKAEAEQLARTIENAADSGACGVVFGRNVWQSADPAAVVSGLKAITYRGDRDTFLKRFK
jgi:class I fructose-bisphosphate aldolase